MEESLYSVIYYLLTPIPEHLNVLGTSFLVENKVSIKNLPISKHTFFPTETFQSTRTKYTGVYYQTGA